MANGFTYTYVRNDNGAIQTVTRSDGAPVDPTDPDFQAYQQAQAAALGATASVTADVAGLQTATQQSADAAVQAYFPPDTSDLSVRVAAIEQWILAFKATNIA